MTPDPQNADVVQVDAPMAVELVQAFDEFPRRADGAGRGGPGRQRLDRPKNASLRVTKRLAPSLRSAVFTGWKCAMNQRGERCGVARHLWFGRGSSNPRWQGRWLVMHHEIIRFWEGTKGEATAFEAWVGSSDPTKQVEIYVSI